MVNMSWFVIAVSRDDTHRFSTANVDVIRLIKGFGVEGDAHAGTTVQHRSRVAADPTQPNMRQAHLIQAELHEELRGQGFEVPAGGAGRERHHSWDRSAQLAADRSGWGRLRSWR
jgi:hypothetical protein